MSTTATLRAEDWIGRIWPGDTRMWLTAKSDGSVPCAITSPPYWGLRDYGGDPLVWGGDSDCGHEWGSPERGRRKDMLPREESTSAGRTGADERQGIGPPGGGSFCLRCSAWRGDLGLEPTPELYISHLVEIFGELRRVLRQDGVFWLVIGDSYASHPNQRSVTDSAGPKQVSNSGSTAAPSRHADTLKPKDLCMIPARLALALQADGWWIRSQIIWAKGISFCPGYSGTVMPESVTDRPTSAYEMIYLLTKSDRYWYDGDAVREESTPGTVDRMAYARSASPKLGVTPGQRPQTLARRPTPMEISGRNLRNVWVITPQPMAWEMCTVCKRVYSPAEYTRLKRLDVCEACGREYVPQQIKYLRRDAEGRRICECGQSDEWKVFIWCECGCKDSWLSHFATFPETLVVPMIQAGCPHKVCAECGAPWVREVERERTFESGSGRSGVDPSGKHGPGLQGGGETRDIRRGPTVRINTLGFRPTCECGGETEPGMVIDPFAGSGTVLLAAHKFGRRAAGCELNSDYVTLAEERIRRAKEQGSFEWSPC